MHGAPNAIICDHKRHGLNTFWLIFTCRPHRNSITGCRNVARAYIRRDRINVPYINQETSRRSYERVGEEYLTTWGRRREGVYLVSILMVTWSLLNYDYYIFINREAVDIYNNFKTKFVPNGNSALVQSKELIFASQKIIMFHHNYLYALRLSYPLTIF